MTRHISTAVITNRDYRQRTVLWINDQNGPRWIRGIAPSEPSSTRPQPAFAPPDENGMCDCCAAAKIVRELDADMARDLGNLPRIDVGVEVGFQH